MMGQRREIRVWDLPVRLFHWCLPVALVVLFVSATGYAMEMHGWVGLAVLALVLFRIVWGFVGSQTARFGDFVVGPRGLVDYLGGGRSKSLGHNPLGGAMVMTLLGGLLVLAVSGLFADDGITYRGPLAGFVSSTWADRISEFHGSAAYGLAALAAVHVAATLLHGLRGENLIGPMVSGRKAVEGDVRPPHFAGLPRACGVLALAIAAVAALLTLG